MNWHDPIPGSLGLPIIGRTGLFYSDFTYHSFRAEKLYGRVFKSRVLGQLVFGFLGAEGNRFVLVDEAKKFSSEGGWGWSIGPMFRNGLLLKDGVDHRRHRSILSAAFTRSALEGYTNEMIPVITKHLDKWLAQSHTLVYDAVKQLTLEVASRVFLGIEMERDIQRVNKWFLDLTHGTIAFVRVPVPGLAWARGLKSRGELVEFLANIIESRRENPGSNMLGRLMTATNEDGDTLSDQEIIDQMIFVMMAAHDTTTSTLTSMFYELGRRRDWRERLRDASLEIDATGGLTFERLGELEKLHWTSQEAIRLHTPLVVIPRRTIEPITYGGYDFPKGVLIGVSPSHTHRMPDYWTEPEAFDPERFSPERAEDKKTPYCYMPFGAGWHACLGKIFAYNQAKLVMHQVLARCDWQLPTGYVARYKQVPIQAPRNGLPMRLRPIMN